MAPLILCDSLKYIVASIPMAIVVEMFVNNSQRVFENNNFALEYN